MKLILKRIAKRKNYTIGRLYLEGPMADERGLKADDTQHSALSTQDSSMRTYLCDTLEPPTIELKTSVSKEKVMESLKVAMPHKPFAIPEGTYKVTLTYSPKFNRLLPLITGSKKFNNIFQGIRIHAGNDPKDTKGCILVGENKIKGMVINSLSTLNKLIGKLQKAENIKMIIY